MPPVLPNGLIFSQEATQRELVYWHTWLAISLRSSTQILVSGKPKVPPRRQQLKPSGQPPQSFSGIHTDSLQCVSGPQQPHEPPHPSSPQSLPSQSGEHAHKPSMQEPCGPQSPQGQPLGSRPHSPGSQPSGTQHTPSGLHCSPVSHTPQIKPQPSFPHSLFSQLDRQHFPSTHVSASSHVPQTPPSHPFVPHSRSAHKDWGQAHDNVSGLHSRSGPHASFNQ